MDNELFVRATRINSSKALGGEVRMKRKQRHFTQAQLAKAAGVGTRFVSELENGKKTLQWDKIMQVLTYLEISLYIGK